VGDSRRRADQGNTEGQNIRANVRSEKRPRTGPFFCRLPSSVAAVKRNIDKTIAAHHFDVLRILETWKYPPDGCFHAHEHESRSRLFLPYHDHVFPFPFSSFIIPRLSARFGALSANRVRSPELMAGKQFWCQSSELSVQSC
jgi:hypothetical protein